MRDGREDDRSQGRRNDRRQRREVRLEAERGRE